MSCILRFLVVSPHLGQGSGFLYSGYELSFSTEANVPSYHAPFIANTPQSETVLGKPAFRAIRTNDTYLKAEFS